jgi:membrane associated rhomboid family serine protease
MSNFQYTRPDPLPPIVKNLIIINVIVFIAQETLGRQYGLTEKISLYPILPRELIEQFQEVRPSYYGFQPFQIATHMFAHGGFMHILFNMFGLWMFGRILENVWGPKRFLFFYLACGVGAAACHLLIQYFTGSPWPALGASGAVMGIFAAFAYLFPNTELYIMFIPVPVKAKWVVIGYIVLDLMGAFGVYTDNIAHFAHLGGALTGFIMVLIFNKSNKKRFY